MAASSPAVVVLGAGLTGLSAAYHLQRAGIAGMGGCELFERSERVGGLATTTEERGYRFDRTGHLLHLKDEGSRQLVTRLLADRYDLIERNSAIWSHGVYTRYPFQANTLGLPPDVAYACVMGFIAARDRAARGETPPIRNFEDYCRANFGDGFSEHFMIPYNTRLWGVPPTDISAAWCQRFVPRPTLEDVVAGAVGHTRGELGYNAQFIYPHEGIGVLAEALAGELGPEAPVRTERAPTQIDVKRREVVFDTRRVGFRRLISTLPLDVLMSLIEDLPDEVSEAANKLRATKLHYLDVALRRPCTKPFHWIYVPEQKYPFYRVGCYSHFSSRMAPPGAGSLYVELAGREPPDLSELLPRVAQHLVEMGLIQSPEAIVFARHRTIEHAYVIFDDDHAPALEILHPFLRAHGIISTGRYGGWNYSSMGDALRFGREAAAEVAEALAREGTAP